MRLATIDDDLGFHKMLASLPHPILFCPEPKRLLSDSSQDEKHGPGDLVVACPSLRRLSIVAVGRGAVAALEESRKWQVCFYPEQMGGEGEDDGGGVGPVVGGDGGVHAGETAEDDQLEKWFQDNKQVSNAHPVH